MQQYQTLYRNEEGVGHPEQRHWPSLIEAAIHLCGSSPRNLHSDIEYFIEAAIHLCGSSPSNLHSDIESFIRKYFIK